jgi:hypothetical protein
MICRVCATRVKSIKKLLQPFWNWLVQKVPLYVAPNTITIVGLLVNIVTACTLLYYNPDGKNTNSPPPWTYLVCALGLFIYQTLDAIGENYLVAEHLLLAFFVDFHLLLNNRFQKTKLTLAHNLNLIYFVFFYFLNML